MVLLRLHLPFFSIFLHLYRNIKFGWHFRLTLNIMKTTKWRYGITSRVPGVPNYHWFLADLDTQCKRCLVEFEDWLYGKLRSYQIIKYATKTGYHYIVFYALSFRQMIVLLADAPYVDEKWLRIGVKRGYWFLETHRQLPDNLPLEYMKARY